MLGVTNIFRSTVTAAVTIDLESPVGVTSLLLSTLDKTESGMRTITPFVDQTEMYSLSDTQALLAIPADESGVLAGEIVDAILVERIS